MAESVFKKDRIVGQILPIDDQEFIRKLRQFFESHSGGTPKYDDSAFFGKKLNSSSINHVPTPVERITLEVESVEKVPHGCPNLEHVSDCRRNAYRTYIKSSNEIKREYADLKTLFTRIGGNPAVAKSLDASPARIKEMDSAVLSALEHGNRQSIKELKRAIKRISIRAQKLITFLYLQKHTFYFRNLQRWTDYAGKAVEQIDLNMAPGEILEKIVHIIIPTFIVLNDEATLELRDFAVRVLPSSIADEEERATTLFTSITTIATFFSSVTATTLQFSYLQTNSTHGSVVNLFWFLSLVFSISSGVNSVLSMSWRKSHIFSEPKPPKPIEIWLNKAPCVFLAVSACMFVVGLNIFPYSSGQANYVSVSTLAFTALHLLGLLIVTTWFLIRLNWDTSFMQSVRRNVLWALLCDDRVVSLNHKFASMHGWSDHKKTVGCPHPMAKLVRCTFVGIKKFARGALRNIEKGIRQGIRDFHSSTRSDAELGEHCSLSGTTVTRQPRDPKSIRTADEEIRNFILHSKNTFSQEFFENTVTEGYEKWKNGSYDTELIETAARYILWGYPEILAEFSNSVLRKMRYIDGHNGDDEKANNLKS